MAELPALHQPNFDIISQCHRNLSTELDKFRNIPAFEGGNAILRAIQELGTKLDRLESRLKVSDVNNVARLSNSLLVSPDAELSVLNNVETNLPIERFPSTPRDIANMNGPMVNAVLRALGMEVAGSIESRRQRLRLQIGLKADPV